MDDIDIPDEDISLAVAQKLGIPNAVDLIDCTLMPFTEKIGLLGDHAFLEATVLDESTGSKTTARFFVKYFPKTENQARFAEQIGAFKKEEFAYEIFSKFADHGVSVITKCTPTCHLAKSNRYLFLDDLEEQGFTPVSKHQYLDYDSVLVILHSLSQLHASSIIFEERKSQQLRTEYRLNREYPDGFDESFFDDVVNKRGVDASIKCVLREIDMFEFPEELFPAGNFSRAAAKVLQKIFDLVKPSPRHRNVLCHGDLWSNNFLVKFNHDRPEKCKFVDFQSARYVPPAHDVLSVIYLTTSRRFRDANMYQMIGMYYSYLEKHVKAGGFDLASVVPFVEFMESCEEQKVFAILQAAIYFPLILMRNDCLEKYFADPDLYEEVFFNDRSQLVVDYVDQDEMYRERLKESIQDLKECCETVAHIR
ncbi:uncharacterized protein LOC132696189 [Cylas formicarius]|uniref:uncharacterized protein LOC132696189 n=1 Tax=Cylas formicarius TaxID=197179 RepID=UPI002958A09E|nr:uncharacterized protein LOC132696189 [Cylas formicarius]XP_060516866.1 uncharacterized protein LOC132696189 [Cylas formicarius]